MMKKKHKLSISGLVALGIVAVPNIVAHADEGVVTSDFTVKDQEGKVVKEYKENEVIVINEKTETQYKVLINGQKYNVDKENVLRTIEHVEESLTVKEDNMTLKMSPDIFGDQLIQLNKGDTLHRISGVEEKNGFVKVKTNQSVEGWVLRSVVERNIKNVPVTTQAFIDEDTERNQSLFYGDEISIVGFENNKYKVMKNEKSLMVDKTAISFSKPEKRVVHIPEKLKAKRAVQYNLDTTMEVIEHNGSLADRIIAEGYQFLGVPYVWGGTTPDGFDCSGFIQYIFRLQGISMPRVASAQATLGQVVSQENLMKGDLVFFETYKVGPSHVGIYLGNGKFLHAGGDRVQISNLSESYYTQRYLFAKRVF